MTQLSSTTFADLFTFARASTGTYVDSSGVIQTASSGTARLTHDPADGTAKGLLIEEARTNLHVYSEDANHWNTGNTNFTYNDTTAPDGAVTADLAVPNTSTTTHNVYKIANGLSNSTSYTLSQFVKQSGSLNYVQLKLGSDGFPANCTATFNISTGAFDSAGADADEYGIEDWGDGWYRIWLVGTTLSSGTNYGLTTTFMDNSKVIAFAGDGISGFHIWGRQLEAGSGPTSYIPTSGATATRAEEACYLQSDDFADVWNADEGTLFVEFSADATNSDALSVLCGAGDGTSDNSIYITVSDAGAVKAVVRQGGTSHANVSGGTYTFGTTSKVAIAWDASGISISLAGAAAVTDASITVPACSRMAIGHVEYLARYQPNGTIKEVRYWPEKLADADLEAMTA